jgi:ribosomal protein L3 glutamine methyltransferase
LACITFKKPGDRFITVRQMIAWAADLFAGNNLCFGHGTNNAQDEAAFIILRSLHLPFDVTDEKLDNPLDPENKEKIIDRVYERIKTHKPAAYILSEAWFAGLPFYINEQVLVPRSPIAELINEGFTPWCNNTEIQNILDIGTGSGCIAVAAALEFYQAEVDATDISVDALAVAAKNIASYGLQHRVRLIESNLFQNLADKKYDLIIANPPYVGDSEMATLPEEYRYEPAIGLHGGMDGLDIVKQILDRAADHLTEKGILVVEVGNSQDALIRQYPHVPFLWLDFEHGGDGVFLFSRDELLKWFQ